MNTDKFKKKKHQAQINKIAMLFLIYIYIFQLINGNSC